MKMLSKKTLTRIGYGATIAAIYGASLAVYSILGSIFNDPLSPLDDPDE